jgi:predicted NBD/HSP70 family sugar kinase
LSTSTSELEKLVLRQVLWRFVNERIFELDARQDGAAADDTVWARCECGRRGCEETLAVGRSQYAETRAAPTRFLVAPGHEFADFQRRTAAADGFVVVETVGEAAAVAARHAAR